MLFQQNIPILYPIHPIRILVTNGKHNSRSTGQKHQKLAIQLITGHRRITFMIYSSMSPKLKIIGTPQHLHLCTQFTIYCIVCITDRRMPIEYK
jgi:hypothetical protein